MLAHVTLRPTRTREHTKTPDDFVRDFYVPGTGIEFVAISDRAALEAGQALLTSLYDEIPCRDEPPFSITMAWAIWKGDYGQAALNAILSYQCEIIGDLSTNKAYVVVRKEPYQAWNGQIYDRLKPLLVVMGDELAQATRTMFESNRIGLDLIEQRLLDPQRVAA